MGMLSSLLHRRHNHVSCCLLPVTPAQDQQRCCCRVFDIGLDFFLDVPEKPSSRDLILGMECLLHAFAPELAGKTIEQVGGLPNCD